MEQAIIDKLHKLLQNSVDDEPRALYLMAELRKLSEQKNLNSEPLLLWYNWALHVRLDRENTTKAWLMEIDEVLDQLVNSSLVKEPISLSLVPFRQTLGERLRSLGLPTRITEDNNEWSKFITAYAGLIDEGIITLEPQKLFKMKYVSSVTFRKAHPTPGSDYPFSLAWIVAVKNCPRFKLVVMTPDLRLNSDGLIGWGYAVYAD